MTLRQAYPCQAVIFDLDGTLIDSSPSILKCFGQVLADSGLPALVPLSDSLIGPPLRQTLINLTGSTDDSLLDRLVEEFKNCYDTEGYKATVVYEGVEAMLAHLVACDIPLSIATNKRRVPTLKILEHLGWEKYFRIIGTLDTPTPQHTDKAAVIRFLLKEMGVKAERSLYVGDKREDGEAAAANGMAFCAAGWGYGEWDAGTMPFGWRLVQSLQQLAN
jgi:phosphoglycolate phosphatase